MVVKWIPKRHPKLRRRVSRAAGAGAGAAPRWCAPNTWRHSCGVWHRWVQSLGDRESIGVSLRALHTHAQTTTAPALAVALWVAPLLLEAAEAGLVHVKSWGREVVKGQHPHWRPHLFHKLGNNVIQAADVVVVQHFWSHGVANAAIGPHFLGVSLLLRRVAPRLTEVLRARFPEQGALAGARRKDSQLVEQPPHGHLVDVKFGIGRVARRGVVVQAVVEDHHVRQGQDAGRIRPLVPVPALWHHKRVGLHHNERLHRRVAHPEGFSCSLVDVGQARNVAPVGSQAGLHGL